MNEPKTLSVERGADSVQRPCSALHHPLCKTCRHATEYEKYRAKHDDAWCYMFVAEHPWLQEGICAQHTPNDQAERRAENPLPPETGSATVQDEYVRLDRTIRDCEHSLLIAERLKARGHNLPESEVDAVRLNLSEAMVERDWMDEWMRRRAKSPNTK